MSVQCEILADSVSEAGSRLTSFKLRSERFLLPEVLTYRSLSRNASSSRAIPTAKLIDAIMNDPAIPCYWGKNRAGMSAKEELTGSELSDSKWAWQQAKKQAVECAKMAAECGLHKQTASRLIEPFAHVNMVITGNADAFLHLFSERCTDDAQPEFCRLAVVMARAFRDSTPKMVELGEWHLPFITDEHRSWGLSSSILLHMSAARCARVSYLSHDGRETTYDEDYDLATRLRDERHMSPFEHQATPFVCAHFTSGNFKGWDQLRKSIVGENRTDFDFATLDRFPAEWGQP